jgi:hypothetical protein
MWWEPTLRCGELPMLWEPTLWATLFAMAPQVLWLIAKDVAHRVGSYTMVLLRDG